MPRRKRKASSSSAAPALDADTLRKLSECGTRTGLNDALEHLAAANWLKPSVAKQMEGDKKRKIERAVQDHAKTDTPYGTVLQHMALPSLVLPQWAIHPPTGVDLSLMPYKFCVRGDDARLRQSR